jgi:hypothetical protein
LGAAEALAVTERWGGVRVARGGQEQPRRKEEEEDEDDGGDGEARPARAPLREWFIMVE